MNMLKLLLIASILAVSGCTGLPGVPNYSSGGSHRAPSLPEGVNWAPVGEYFTVRSRRELDNWRCPGNYFMYAVSHVGIHYECICLPRSELNTIMGPR